MPIVSHRSRLSASSSSPPTLFERFSSLIIIRFITEVFHEHVTKELAIYAIKSLRDLAFMGAELLTENTMIQVVSLVQHNRVPLRDLAKEYFNDERRSFIDFAYFGASTYQVETNSVLLLWVLYCFLHGPRGMHVLQKGVRCLTLARTLRVFTFTMTVLPNPNPQCNFTGPVDPLNLSPGGACNDLLYSGHVIVYTISATAVTILCSRYPYFILRVAIRAFIWIQVFQRIIRAIIELHHYSVDMFLGLCVTLLIWNVDFLYYDLPALPKPLYPHLKKLIAPFDDEGHLDELFDILLSIFQQFKRQPFKAFNDLIINRDFSVLITPHVKQV